MAKIKSGKQEKTPSKQAGIKAGAKGKSKKKQFINDPSVAEQDLASDADNIESPEQLRKKAFEPLESRTAKYNKDPKQSGKITSGGEQEKADIVDSDGEEAIDLKDLEADGTEDEDYKKHIYE